MGVCTWFLHYLIASFLKRHFNPNVFLVLSMLKSQTNAKNQVANFCSLCWSVSELFNSFQFKQWNIQHVQLNTKSTILNDNEKDFKANRIIHTNFFGTPKIQNISNYSISTYDNLIIFN